MSESIEHLKLQNDFKGLMDLRSSLRGPVQLMQVNSALAEVFEEEEMWEEAAEAWRECLVLSPANPDLWDRMGDAALKAGRIPLALSSLQTAYDLGKRLPVLLKVAKIRLDLHDYANALALASFIVAASPQSREAEALKTHALAVMQGQVLHQGKLIKPRAELVPNYVEKQVFKVANMTSLAKAIRRQMELGKDDCILIFQRIPGKESFEVSQPAARPAAKKQKGALAAFNMLSEDIKREVLAISEPTVLPLFGLNPPPVLPNWKAKCSAEPCLDAFLDAEWRLQPLVHAVITTLCKNCPRPNPALSDELGWETLHLYLIADPPIELEDEVLTLFELALKDTEHVSTLQKLQQAVLAQQSLLDAPELRVRMKYALAWCYYHVGEDKSKEDQADALISAYALLDEVESLLGDKSYYYWWYGKVLSKASISSLKENIKDEMLLTKASEALKSNPKGSTELLNILSSLCSLLKKRSAKDDPAFYWRKAKVVLKNLSKCTLEQSERLQFSQCLSVFLGVLQYNLEDGSKLSRDVDLRLILKTAARAVFSKSQKPRLQHETYAAVAAVNIVKARTDLFPELPFFLKKVLLSAESKAQYFLRFHLLCGELASGEKDFHFSLCRAFEKPAFLSNNLEAMNIIYAQLYGFALLTKECPCKLPKITPPDTSFPKSVGKLKRMLEFVYRNSVHAEDYGVYFPQTYDKGVSPVLERCILRLPGLHLDCVSLKQASAIVSGVLASGGQCTYNHLECCSSEVRPIAELFYQRYAADCYELALKKESHSSFLSLLDSAEGCAEKLLLLNQRSATGWLLLGQIYLHKWMAGYFDHAILHAQKPEYMKFAELSLKCFSILQGIDPKAEGHINLVRGLVQLLQYRLTGSGLVDAQRYLQLALQSTTESESLETLMITALLELHLKSPQAALLLDKINSETKGKYEYLRRIAQHKACPSGDTWKALETCEQSDPYLSYILAKKLPEEYRDHLVSAPNCFVFSQKLFETKVMDRCLAFHRKRVKAARRYVLHFAGNGDWQGLYFLARELMAQKAQAFADVWEEAVGKLAVLIRGGVSDVAELKFFYEFQEWISASEVLSPDKKASLLSQLSETLAKFHEVFGPEKCEALRPSKRRRKK